jgi:DNA repair exonuclease SbcCD nuclease subunit
MYKKVAHLADIHLSNDLERHVEQSQIIDKTIESLKNDKPDLIVIVGDLFDNFVKPYNETNILASKLLKSCIEISEVVIIDGNHDMMKTNLNRVSSIKTIVNIINDKRIHYFDKTDFFKLKNITFAVWYHPDRKSPWISETGEETHQKEEGQIYIDLFHDPINQCILQNGMTNKDDKAISLSDFKGDIVMAGDIHLQQSFQKDGKEFFAYPSSLYCTNYGEGDDKFHGYLLWDIVNKTFDKKQINSDYKYFNIYVHADYDYDNIDINLTDPGKQSYIKIHWQDYSSTYKTENKNKLKKYLVFKYPSIKVIKFDTSKLINKNLLVSSLKEEYDVNNTLDNEELFKTFLKEKGYDDDFINEILDIDRYISSLIQKEESTSIEWKIKSLSLDNFKSHGDLFTINLEKLDGIIQIVGENQIGKCVHPDTEIEIEYDEDEIQKVLGYIPDFLK